MTRRHNTVCTVIEYVLSQQTGWLTTAEVAERVNRLSPLNVAGSEASHREVRNKLQTLWRDGRVHRDGRGYSWRWRP